MFKYIFLLLIFRTTYIHCCNFPALEIKVSCQNRFVWLASFNSLLSKPNQHVLRSPSSQKFCLNIQNAEHFCIVDQRNFLESVSRASVSAVCWRESRFMPCSCPHWSCKRVCLSLNLYYTLWRKVRSCIPVLYDILLCTSYALHIYQRLWKVDAFNSVPAKDWNVSPWWFGWVWEWNII